MKIQNITDVEKFFKVVDQCKGTVELVSPEGDRINLKSKLAQYLSMATIFSNGYIKELDLVAHDKEDIERLIKYMYQGEQTAKYLKNCGSTSFSVSRSFLFQFSRFPDQYFPDLFFTSLKCSLSHKLASAASSVQFTVHSLT